MDRAAFEQGKQNLRVRDDRGIAGEDIAVEQDDVRRKPRAQRPGVMPAPTEMLVVRNTCAPCVKTVTRSTLDLTSFSSAKVLVVDNSNPQAMISFFMFFFFKVN